MEDIKKKRYYIYENIHKLKNHNQIIDLINIKNCKYTENDNGIFLNLNTLDEKIITMIYHIILNTINYKEEVYNSIEENNTEELFKYTSDKKEPTKKIENCLTYKEFSKKDHEIISYSKKYNV